VHSLSGLCAKKEIVKHCPNIIIYNQGIGLATGIFGSLPCFVANLIVKDLIVVVHVGSSAKSSQVVREGEHKVSLEYIALNVLYIYIRDIPPNAGVLTQKIIDIQ
jgi:hypothetical protein